MAAYYNEIDPVCCAVLRKLIEDGVIAPGDVDSRSVEDVAPSDLEGYEQVHLFAGGGLWSVAMRLAGVPDNFPVWTGSCPCQPFSGASNKGKAEDDARHLWPHFHRLIANSKPNIVFGEQVSSKAGKIWLSRVHDGLEESGYRFEAFDIPACAIGAPHIRQRFYFVATRLLADPEGFARGLSADWHFDQWRESGRRFKSESGTSEFAFSSDAQVRESSQLAFADDFIARRRKPGFPVLDDGQPPNVDFERIVGNQIVAPLAAEFIAAYFESL